MIRGPFHSKSRIARGIDRAIDWRFIGLDRISLFLLSRLRGWPGTDLGSTSGADLKGGDKKQGLNRP